MDWQPIKTAPKDGSSILAFSDEICSNCSPKSCGIYVTRWVDGAWIFGRLDNGAYLSNHHLPTHWRPLPEPPTLNRVKVEPPVRIRGTSWVAG